jgi:excisionase family DNA binding protein
MKIILRDTDLLTPGEVGDIFRVGTKQVARWAKDGKIRAVKTLGGHRRYYRGEVDARLRGQPLTGVQYDALIRQAVRQS